MPALIKVKKYWYDDSGMPNNIHTEDGMMPAFTEDECVLDMENLHSRVFGGDSRLTPMASFTAETMSPTMIRVYITVGTGDEAATIPHRLYELVS